jgi:Fuc2NAc and GlcNAc transferase
VWRASFLFPFYADELNTMLVRIRNGEKLLRPHRRHIYQLLANEKGIPHWKVSVGYGLLQAAVGLSVLWVKPLGLTPVIVLLAVWFSGFFVFSSFVRRSLAHPA